MSDVFCNYVGHSECNIGRVRRVRRFLGYTAPNMVVHEQSLSALALREVGNWRVGISNI